ncbi:hypothetical protein ACFRAQ_35965 [Nocardia sp. NPDC056611]|uniref:hypothetical protein n=1 Tax=Nocardia sp. NPDC056611 TaxID=3345877 RepID=UPI00366A8C13
MNRIQVRSVRAYNGRVQGWAVLVPTPDGRLLEYAFMASWIRAMEIADYLGRRLAKEAA